MSYKAIIKFKEIPCNKLGTSLNFPPYFLLGIWALLHLLLINCKDKVDGEPRIIVSAIDTIDLSGHIAGQKLFQIRTDYNHFSLYDHATSNLFVYNSTGLNKRTIDLPKWNELVKVLEETGHSIIVDTLEIYKLSSNKSILDISVDDFYFNGDNYHFLLSIYVPEIVQSEAPDTVIKLNPYFFYIEGDTMNSYQIFNIPGKVTHNTQQYYVSSYASFCPAFFGQKNITLKVKIDPIDSTSLPFIAYFAVSGRTLQLSEVLAFDLPDYFVENNFYYNYTDYILDRNRIIFKWYPQIYSVEEPFSEVFEVYNDRVSIAGSDPGTIRFYLYGFRYGSEFHQALVFDQYKIMYHRFNSSKILAEVEIPIDVREIHTSMAFIGDDKLIAFKPNRRELIVFKIYEE